MRHVFACVLAGRDVNARDATVSLWAPWDSAAPPQHGPERFDVPDKLWLLGLGHLGQAYVWNLCFLPPGGERLAVLQDDQSIGEGKRSYEPTGSSRHRPERRQENTAGCVLARSLRLADATDRTAPSRRRRDNRGRSALPACRLGPSEAASDLGRATVSLSCLTQGSDTGMRISKGFRFEPSLEANPSKDYGKRPARSPLRRTQIDF